MIDARELRIGNWVSCELEGKTHQVQITANDFVAYMLKPIDFFKPIPLTPELLEKAGFKIVVGQAFTATAYKDGVELHFLYPAIDESLEVVFGFKNLEGQKKRRKMKYLHEVQNLIFSLTGQELDLKL